jgi:hypothetical protein
VLPLPLRQKPSKGSGANNRETQGDAGLPDLILCKPPRLIFAELKSERGRVRAEQQAWLDALRQCAGVEVYLWRPSDWASIVETLKHP